MLHQTIIWTALPKALDGPFQEGSTVRLSAFISPRLWSSTPEVNEKLSSYADFVTWPDKVKTATFKVDFGDGVLRDAVPDFSKLRLDLWQALFKDQAKVVPFVFEDYSCADIEPGPVAGIEDILKNVYQEVATDPVYGGGVELPKAVDLSKQPVLDAIGRPYVPEEPPEARPGKPRPPAEEGPEPGDGEPGGPGAPGDGDEPDGCVYGCLSGCLMIPVRLLKLLAKLMGAALMAPFMAITQVPPGDAKNSVDQLGAALTPYQKVPEDSPAKLPGDQEIKDEYDFHSMIASAGDYPWLLKGLGLVVDLEVPLSAPLPPATSTVKIVPNLTLSMANSTQVAMKTRYDLADNRFLAQSRPVDGEIGDGFLKVDDSNKFRVVQVDAVGGGVKLTNFASNLRLLGDDSRRPENSSEEAGLPALRTAGLALVKPNLVESVKADLKIAAALNAHVALLDNSPLVPCPTGAPPLPPRDELFAEDLVRGYCIDVFDNQSSSWHSLCQRDGDYDFGNGLTEPSIVDEGFVVLGGTEPLAKGGANDPIKLRMFESLITWSGWSLVAPRPGQTILSEVEEPLPGQDVDPAAYKTEYPSNPAATEFPMSATFKAVSGSLPRLRFGWKYHLRARVVDLAGNRVVEPSDAAFQTDGPHKTGVITYGRFEPVDPPPVVLKEEPTWGESLERLVVRSNFDDQAADVQKASNERHIVPPKTSQLMAEQLGHFDGSPQMLTGLGAYAMASREAGTLLEELNQNTKELVPVDGAKVVVEYEKDPQTGQDVLDADGNKIVVHTFHLQTKDTFTVTYLPDPLARGVLLLGLPGVSPFEHVVDPTGGKIVNKIPFEGAWPDPKPFRLRLIGRKALGPGESVKEPLWEGTKRTLTVELPQGEKARVRISCYFDETDLEKMGICHWIEETAVPHLNQLLLEAKRGRNWLQMPWRTLVLVHATRQPLAIPKISAMQADKLLGETGVQLSGTIDVDAKSTGKLDLRATWSDPLDDPNKPSFNQATDKIDYDAQVTELFLEEGGADALQVPRPHLQDDVKRLRHEFGDTKFHLVTYQALGTTSFREYFDPPQNDAEIRTMMRPTPDEIQNGTAEAFKSSPVIINNSVRPDAPKVLYVLPTFQWTESSNGPVFTHGRVSGGLRVYLERPWYSSGDRELLGVLLRPEHIQAEPDTVEAMKKYVSQWGMDPVWNSERTEPLRKDHLVEWAAEDENLSLDERPRSSAGDDRGVDVVGYEAHYDDQRHLWFAEVAFDPGVVQSYFPFVRLGLARFQPHSAGDKRESAHLSRVMRSDFVQLPPERTVEYDTANVTGGSVSLRVWGPAGVKFEQPNRMVVSVERRDTRVLDEKDPLGWQQVGDLTFLQPDMSQGLANVMWHGVVNLPATKPSPMRLVVREWEVLPADADSTVRMPWESEDMPPPTSLVGFKSQRSRTVFADELILP